MSLQLSASLNLTGSFNLSGSMSATQVLNITASVAQNSITSSYISASNVTGTVVSSSYSLSSSYSPTNITSSWSTNSLTASYTNPNNTYAMNYLNVAGDVSERGKLLTQRYVGYMGNTGASGYYDGYINSRATSGTYVYNSLLDNALYNAATRFALQVNNTSSANNGYFDGNFGSIAYNVAINDSASFYLNFTGSKGVNGFTYPQGYVYLNFYYTSNPLSCSGYTTHNGVQYPITNWTIINGTSSSIWQVWRGTVNANNYMQDMLVAVTASATTIASLVEWEYAMTRPGEAEPTVITKYNDNSYYNKLTFYNTSNTASIVLNPNASSYFTSNRLGIGTTSPSGYLNVYSGSLNTIPAIKVEGATTGTPSIIGLDIANASSSNTPQVQFTLEKSVAKAFEISTKSGSASLTSRLTIQTDTGNVGVGTTTPLNLLDVKGAVAIGSTYAGTNAAPASGLLVQGNVGIGSTNPANALDVVGNISASGNITLNTLSASQLNVSNGNSPSWTNVAQLNAGNAGAVNAGAVITLQPASASLRYDGGRIYGGRWGTNNGGLRFAGIFWSNSGSYGTENLTFDIDARANAFVFLTGSVGIGTTNPVNKLDVVGNISASNITASLFFGTSSWAQSASNAGNSLTASYLTPTNNYNVNILSSSYINNSNTIYTNDISASNNMLLGGYYGLNNSSLNMLAGYTSSNSSFNVSLINFASATATQTVQNKSSVWKTSTSDVYFCGTTAGIDSYYGYSGSISGGGTYINFSQNGVHKDFHVTYNNGPDLLSVNSSGYVGVGIATASNATARLHISGSTANETELLIQNSSGTNLLFVSSSGKIGFGTNNPVNTLDVIGNISASNVTASLFFGTSSWSNNSLTASSLTVANSYTITDLTASGNISASGTGSFNRLGIGLTSPNAPVHISSSLTGQAIILNIQSAGQSPGIQLTGTDRTAAIYPNGRSSGIRSTTLDLWTDNAAYINFNNSNGTTAYGYVGQRSATVFAITSNSDLQLGATGSTQVFISGSGNVGIGTTNPVNKLDVVGNISASIITASLFSGSHSGSTFGTSSWSTNSLTASSLVPTNSYTVTTLNVNSSGSTSASTNGSLTITGQNTKGGSNYHDFLYITNTVAGGVNPNKSFRLNDTGNLEIINSNYGTNIFTLTDSGSLQLATAQSANVTQLRNTGAGLKVGNYGLLFDDGNVHLHSTNPNSNLWLNCSGSGLFIINGQSGATGGVGIGTSIMSGYVTVNGGSNVTIGAYGYLINTGSPPTGTGGGTTGTFSITCNQRVQATEFDATSDERLKNIEGEIPLNEAVDLINKIIPIKYKWKDGVDTGTKTGYSAQQVYKAGFDHLVGVVKKDGMEEIIDEDGFINPKDAQFVMNYEQVTPYHSKLIKYLIDKIESMESEIQLLKSQVNR